MRKWTVIVAAIVFTMGLAATGFAFGPDIEANGNDLVGAANGGTAANDQSIAVGDADLAYDASTNTDTENVTVTKTETETNTANSSFNDTDTKNVDVSKTVDVTKNNTEQANVSGDGAAANNGGTALDITTGDVLPDNHSETYNDSNDDNRSFSKEINVTETETSSSNESQYESQYESQFESQYESQYENMDGQVATDSGTNTNTELEDFAKVGNDGAAANNGGKAINNSFNGNQVAGEIENDNHVPGEKVVNVDESVDNSYSDTSTYEDTSTYNKQEAEAEGLGNASAVGGDATTNVDKSYSDSSTYNKQEASAEGLGNAASVTGDATSNVDKSFNLTIGDISTAISKVDLGAEVSGNSIGGGYGLDGFSDGPFGFGKGSGSELKIETGSNTVDNFTSTGIGAVNQNTGVQSSVQQSVNVNATVGSIQ